MTICPTCGQRIDPHETGAEAIHRMVAEASEKIEKEIEKERNE